jgi:hypothetical protein
LESPEIIQNTSNADAVASAEVEDAAAAPLHRRILQIDYAVGQLPGGLEWLGV